MIDLTTFYFQYLDIDFDKENDISKLLDKYPLRTARFDKVSIEDVKSLMVTLFKWFDSKKLTVVEIFIINHSPGFKQDIHVDYVTDNKSKIALNIPLTPLAAESTTRMYDILNQEQSFTIKARDSKDDTEIKSNVKFCKFEPEKVKLVTKYHSTNPVLLNITKPHSAWNNTEHIRGVISFRFDDIPENFIKEYL